MSNPNIKKEFPSFEEMKELSKQCRDKEASLTLEEKIVRELNVVIEEAAETIAKDASLGKTEIEVFGKYLFGIEPNDTIAKEVCSRFKTYLEEKGYSTWRLKYYHNDDNPILQLKISLE